MTTNKFNIREICQNPKDGDFVLAAFDAALLHLAAIGSGAQWGSQPFSEMKGYYERVHQWIPMSEAYRRGEEGSEPFRMYIAEVEVDNDKELSSPNLSVRVDENGRHYLSVAAATVREHWWPDHIKQANGLRSVVEEADAKGGAFYLEALISDYRTGSARKGAGAALVQKIREYSQSRGATQLFLECWAGNDGNLVKSDLYYEKQGFTTGTAFIQKGRGGDDWPGKLLKMDLT